MEVWQVKLAEANVRPGSVVVKALKGFPRGRRVIHNAQMMLNSIAAEMKSSQEMEVQCIFFFKFGTGFAPACKALCGQVELGVLSKPTLRGLISVDSLDKLLGTVATGFYKCILLNEESDGVTPEQFTLLFNALYGCRTLLELHSESHWAVVQGMFDAMRFVSEYNRVKTLKAIPEQEGDACANVLLTGAGGMQQWEGLAKVFKEVAKS
jgi:hypothetical protein